MVNEGRNAALRLRLFACLLRTLRMHTNTLHHLTLILMITFTVRRIAAGLCKLIFNITPSRKGCSGLSFHRNGLTTHHSTITRVQFKNQLQFRDILDMIAVRLRAKECTFSNSPIIHHSETMMTIRPSLLLLFCLFFFSTNVCNSHMLP